MFNKKAQEEYLSIWNVLVWVVLAIVIVIAISIYNNGTADARASESEILNKKILDCVTQDGVLIKNFNQDFSIYESCSISPSLFESSLELFVEIELFESQNPQPVVSIFAGNSELGFQCDIQSDNQLAGCFSETIFVNSQNNNEIYQLKIKTASNHEGRKLK